MFSEADSILGIKYRAKSTSLTMLPGTTKMFDHPPRETLTIRKISGTGRLTVKIYERGQDLQVLTPRLINSYTLFHVDTNCLDHEDGVATGLLVPYAGDALVTWTGG